MTPFQTQLDRRFSRFLGARAGVFLAAALWLVPL
jgi:hypothetical protein